MTIVVDQNDWNIPSKGKGNGVLTTIQRSKQRRKQAIQMFADGKTRIGICEELGVGARTWDYWRKHDSKFAAEIDAIHATRRMAKSFKDEELGEFALFRKAMFNHDSPWFHNIIIQALEEAQPGSLTVVLIPPQHGKTTLLEDYANYKFAHNPNFRIAVGCERKEHALKILSRVRDRMDCEGGHTPLVTRFGPFRAERGSSESRDQIWTSQKFNLIKKDSGERDYNMEAFGMSGSIVGTRTDLLHLDDPQSLSSLNQSEQLAEKIRQDFMSRPGMTGSTVLVQTRVGNNDLPEILEGEKMIDTLIKIPAWTEEDGWLWPELYSEKQYLLMKRNAGEEAWARNFMQQPRSKGSDSFSDLMKQRSVNDLRAISHDPPRPKDGGATRCVIGLDPGYGVNATTITAFDTDKLYFLDGRADAGFTRPEQIIQVIEDYCARFTLGGGERSYISDVVIEQSAFQKGILGDERLIELQKRYGFNIRPHDTGINKYDENIGIPQMGHSMLRGEFDFPYADEISVARTDALWHEFFAWRPKISGKRLTQDRVMALWFCFILWRRSRNSIRIEADEFNFEPNTFGGAKMRRAI